MLFTSYLNNWQQRREEKKDARLLQMRSLGKCPECRGTGYNFPYHVTSLEYIPPTNLDCPDCNGSGLFTDWATTHNRVDLL